MRRFSALLFPALLLFSPAVSLGGQATTYELNLLPDSGLVANVAIDIIEHSGGVWLATGKGVVHSFDGGRTWLSFNDGNGLVSDDISAMLSIGGRLWVGTNRGQVLDERLESISDGISFSDDNGNSWTQIDFGSSGLNIPFVFGGNQTVFDITGHIDTDFSDKPGLTNEWLFFPAFAGGLLASLDGGMSWRRIFPSVTDSIQFADPGQPSLRNRDFSAAVDSSHSDSLFLWTGTAGGVFQYIFAPPREKLFSKFINTIIFCDNCSGPDGGQVYYGGTNSLSFSAASGSGFGSVFEDEGLPGREITALFDLNGRLLVGTADPATAVSTGLAFSSDGAASFTPVPLAAVSGAGNKITDFQMIGTRLHMAASKAGLFVSADTGMTWSGLLLDASNPASAVNSVNALGSLGDTLYAGTDSGFVIVYFSPTGLIDSSLHVPLTETVTTSERVIRLRVQPFISDTITFIPDSVALWAITRPISAVGAASVLRSVDAGKNWSVMQAPVSYDIGFLGDSVFVVGEFGIRLSLGGSDPTITFSAKQFITGGIEVANLDRDTVTSVAISGDTIIFGTGRGTAISNDGGASFTIFRPNLDTLRADLVINFTATNTFEASTQEFGLSGDFVPSMRVQYRNSGPARLWASGRSVDFGGDGISVARFVPIVDTLGDTTIAIDWETLYFDGFAWNFAFAGDSIFAATNAGLLLNLGDFTNDSTIFLWDTVQLVDPVTGAALLEPNTAIFAVEVIGDTLWLGTDDGTISIDLANPTNQKLYQVVDSTTSPEEVYAFPVPFSGRRGDRLDFHFVIEQDGPVTLEIYDFAMNLVARPIDNQIFPAGIYPSGNAQGTTWDGRNGDGVAVAVGVYYFKVEQSNGTVRWGKLAVIP